MCLAQNEDSERYNNDEKKKRRTVRERNNTKRARIVREAILDGEIYKFWKTRRIKYIRRTH